MVAINPVLLHQHSGKEDVFPHDGGDIDLPAGRLGLTICQLAKDKEDGNRAQQSDRSNDLFHFLTD